MLRWKVRWILFILALGVPARLAGQDPAGPEAAPADDPHAAVFAESLYPSAAECASCHETIYEEWRFSSHAYASISPMFNKFEQKINDLAQGTVGYFCLRCHASVGTALGERRDLPLWERAQISREGVTCVSCHRVSESYGKVNGERRIIPGDIFEPMYGAIGGDGVKEVVGNREAYNVALTEDQFGIRMHREGIKFEQISKSEFCVSCHQVAVHPGIKLETVWDEYRASAALKEGVTCQDCHMSTSPGQPSGYARGPAAVVNGRAVKPDRKHANHAFVGPGYPIAHPGIFPHHPDADRFTVPQWLGFDYRAGWGTDSFEDKVASGGLEPDFPEEWKFADDRVEARLIVDSNLEKLEEKRELRLELFENSSRIDGPFFKGTPRVGKSLHFSYKVTNLNRGHNMPSGSLGAQPEIWLNVALIDPQGNNVWESGYVDSHGDMADLHSLDVAAGTIPHDGQLFNLQSKFLTTNLKGTDREMYLPVNLDIDQIPFIRPANVPTSVLNHPPFIRMEKRSLPPLGSRVARYTVPGSLLKAPGTYRLAVRLRSRAEPIYFMKFVDATVDMEHGMNEWMADIHPYTVAFEVGAGNPASAVGVVAAEEESAEEGPEVDAEAQLVEHDPGAFGPDPSYEDKPYDPQAQRAIYGGKYLNRTARPPIELGRKLYREGAYSPAGTAFGEKNPSATHLMVFGDWRTAAAYNDNGVPNAQGVSHQSTVATRLNLDFDFKLTATERFHAFVRPLDKDGSFTRYDIDGKNEGFEGEFDFNLESLFFEGEVGSLAMGITGLENTIDLPFAVGFMPLLTQNGVWLEDAFIGAAATIPAFHSRSLDISNFDLTFFLGLDEVTTAAVREPDGTLDEHAANVIGVAGFVDANRGYWEFGYGYVDASLHSLSYHNVTVAFTKRYGAFISNSLRLVGNLGQDPDPGREKTADGVLLLIENSLITSRPSTLVPYLNLFVGVDRPQALARAADAGGILKNTGINFETDGLTGFPKLDDRGHDSYGGALGVEYLFNLDQQLVVEAAVVERIDDAKVLGAEYALGVRYQRPFTNAWILRFDTMSGWREEAEDLFGVRVEVRRKF